jgi:hypothetical protein
LYVIRIIIILCYESESAPCYIVTYRIRCVLTTRDISGRARRTRSLGVCVVRVDFVSI